MVTCKQIGEQNINTRTRYDFLEFLFIYCKQIIKQVSMSKEV